MKRFDLLVVIGLVIGFFGLIIPYADIMPEIIENRIFLRFILVSGSLFSAYGAINFKGFHKSVSIAIGGGVIAFLGMSTYNLLCDTCIDTYNYYFVTFLITTLTLITLTIIRAWNTITKIWKQVFHRSS